MLNCENEFCIYWENDVCTLQKISLNHQGICQDCICVAIADDILQSARERILQEYAQVEARWESSAQSDLA